MSKAQSVQKADASLAIMTLLEARGSGASICPSEAARLVDPTGWRDHMPTVHEAARALVADGVVALTQGGVEKEPAGFKGAYRIRKR